MSSFESLGLSPDMVEALATEGVEFPTPLQNDVIPVLRKGNAALVRGSTGAGVQVAWAAPLLDRVEPAPGGPAVLVLVPTEAQALDTARSLGMLAGAMGLRTASLGGPFALPGHAEVLMATPAGLRAAVGRSDVSLAGVQAIIALSAAAILAEESEAKALESLFKTLPMDEVQRVVISDPVNAPVRTFVESHLKRAVFLPADAAQTSEGAGSPVERGTLQVRVRQGEEILALASLAGDLLSTGARHLLLFFRSEDRAADLGDLLTLHGFVAGAPGDRTLPLWLATDAQGMQALLRDMALAPGEVLPVSVDVPPDPDTLDQRHHGRGGLVFASASEMAHLRRICGEAGYVLEHPAPETSHPDPGPALLEAVTRVLGEEDLAPYHHMLRDSWARFTPEEVGAALAFLLRRKDRASASVSAGERLERGSGRAPATQAPRSTDASEAGAPRSFVRLFLSVGSKDGIGPGELLGAITGEAEIQGSQVGKIELRDTFSRVEVDSGVAERVIRALNGTTIRGRSVRADYDRGAGRGDRDPAPRGGPRPGGGARPGSAPRSGGGAPRGGSGAPRSGGGAPRGGGGAPGRGGGAPRGGGGAPGRGPRRGP